MDLPSGNQTWLAGKSPISEGFDRKITDKWSIFQLKPCLIIGGYKPSIQMGRVYYCLSNTTHRPRGLPKPENRVNTKGNFARRQTTGRNWCSILLLGCQPKILLLQLFHTMIIHHKGFLQGFKKISKSPCPMQQLIIQSIRFLICFRKI